MSIVSIIAANVDNATFPRGEAEPGGGDAVYARACDAKAIAGNLSERILDDFQSFDEPCYVFVEGVRQTGSNGGFGASASGARASR